MRRWVSSEIPCATISVAGSPDETRGPIPICNALHQSQKTTPALSPPIPAFPVSPDALAKDTANEVRQLPRGAPFHAVHSTSGCCSKPQREFPSARAAPLDPASAQSREKPQSPFCNRSEERRVGKECRSRW